MNWRGPVITRVVLIMNGSFRFPGMRDREVINGSSKVDRKRNNFGSRSVAIYFISQNTISSRFLDGIGRYMFLGGFLFDMGT